MHVSARRLLVRVTSVKMIKKSNIRPLRLFARANRPKATNIEWMRPNTTTLPRSNPASTGRNYIHVKRVALAKRLGQPSILKDEAAESPCSPVVLRLGFYCLDGGRVSIRP